MVYIPGAMRPCPASCRRVLVLALAFTGACSDHTPVAPADATPEKQFIFDGVRIEDRDQQGLSWVGTAKRATGDLDRADAEGIRIRHYPEAVGGRPVDILAPRGRLGFDDQQATLESVRIVTPDQGVITGGLTHYLGKESRVVLDGPIALDARGLTATASSAVVSLDEGVLDVEGPVVGRYQPSRGGTSSDPAPVRASATKP